MWTRDRRISSSIYHVYAQVYRILWIDCSQRSRDLAVREWVVISQLSGLYKASYITSGHAIPLWRLSYLLFFLKTPPISHKLFWANIAVVTRQIVFTLHFCTGLWLKKNTSRKGFRQSSAFFEKLFRYKAQADKSLPPETVSLLAPCYPVSQINTARLFDIKWQSAYTYWQVSMVCLAVKERKFNSDK